MPCPVHPPPGRYAKTYKVPPGWAAIRSRVLARDPICVLCRERPSTDVDHINGRDDHSLEHLRGLCRRCHLQRTHQQGEAAKRRKKQLREIGLESLR
jgi:5-methylcytosine-specific restriction endonuclease McrA